MHWAVTIFEGMGGDRGVVLKRGWGVSALGGVKEKELRFRLTFPGDRDVGFLDASGLNVCHHLNYTSICIYLHKCHYLKAKLLSPLPWERGRGWTVPPAIPISLPDRETVSHPPSPALRYPLLSSLVPLAQRSLWSTAASLHPSF